MRPNLVASGDEASEPGARRDYRFCCGVAAAEAESIALIDPGGYGPEAPVPAPPLYVAACADGDPDRVRPAGQRIVATARRVVEDLDDLPPDVQHGLESVA